MPTPPRIQHVEAVLTAGCNLTCGYCYQNDKKSRSMAWETLRASADLVLGARPGASLLFIGGEPLLEFPLVRQAVEYIEARRPRSQRVRYEIITNGTLLREEQAAFLVEHDFDVQLSFDGVPAAQALRGPGTFAVLDRLLDRLRAEHNRFFVRRLSVALTFVPDTIRHLADSIDYFLGKDLRRLTIAPAITHQPGWRNERMAELDGQLGRIFEACLTHYRQTGQVPLALFAKQRGRKARVPSAGPTCGAGRGVKAAVDVDGQAHGCVMFVNSYQKFPTSFLRRRLDTMALGDVRDPGFARRVAAYPAAARATGLFHGKRDKYSSYGRCRQCLFLDECNICPVSIGHDPSNTDPDRMPDFQCAYNLVSLKYRRRFPAQARALTLPVMAPMPERLRRLFGFSRAKEAARR